MNEPTISCTLTYSQHKKSRLFRKHCALDISGSGDIKAQTTLTWTPHVGVARGGRFTSITCQNSSCIVNNGLYIDVKDI